MCYDAYMAVVLKMVYIGMLSIFNILFLVISAVNVKIHACIIYKYILLFSCIVSLYLCNYNVYE